MFRALILVLLLTSCTTIFREDRNSHVVPDLQASVSDLRACIVAIMPVGHRAISPNGRELLSKHFIIENRQFKPAGDALERYFVKFLVLGDRRPYTVEIVVAIEERTLVGNSFTYKVVDYDLKLAKELERKLREQLTKRLEDRNIIDDFRVF